MIYIICYIARRVFNMLLIDFLFLKGMNIEEFERKVYSGFDGSFDLTFETGYKYHLYFENINRKKYEMIFYDEECISKNGWSVGTIGYMEFYNVNRFPEFSYVPTKVFEPFNIELYKDSPYITTPYFDFSKFGEDEECQRGFAKINMECFELKDSFTELELEEYKKEYRNFVKQFKQNPDSVYEKDLIEDVLSSWNMSSYLRKKGVLAMQTSANGEENEK